MVNPKMVYAVNIPGREPGLKEFYETKAFNKRSFGCSLVGCFLRAISRTRELLLVVEELFAT